MEEATVPVQKGGSTNGEFAVHTKHTCDKCFQQPIIGKRYKSSVHRNFDLCARCADAYSGPEIGLEEEVLARDQKHSSEFVLKLKIDNGGDVQVRRIKVSEVWGKTISHLSFGKMMAIASSFAFPENEVDDAGLDAFIAKAKATYIDEDGDVITMTSNKELEDAFLQVIKKFPPVHKPFVITVTVPKDKPGKVCVVADGKASGMPKRIQLRKVEPKKAFSVSVGKPMAGCNSKTTLRVTPQKFEKDFFIHARHTCDGCSKSPIIGTRYKATKIPDFDLCVNCFEKYEGEDLDFKPEIQDRDRRMQQRWLRRQISSSSSKASSNIAGAWNKANGDLADFLKKVQASGATIESATVYACPYAKGGMSASEFKVAGEVPPAQKTPGEDCTGSLKEAPESAGVEAASSKSPPLDALAELIAQHSAENPEETIKFVPGGSVPDMQDEPSALTHDKPEVPWSPAASHDESFLSDADGSGSIAEAIGRTLDVCVAAIEDAMAEELEKVDAVFGADKAKPQKPYASKTSSDAFSVASSMASSMTEILKNMEEKVVPQLSDHAGGVFVASASVPAVITGATILKSEDGTEKGKVVVEMHKVEDASDGEDEWSVIDDDKDKSEVSDKSALSVEPISPVVLAKWDTELRQLHELGFLEDHRNVDTLEHLEASHIGVDSTEKVTVNAAVEHLLG